jgi:hypothetical protein
MENSQTAYTKMFHHYRFDYGLVNIELKTELTTNNQYS